MQAKQKGENIMAIVSYTSKELDKLEDLTDWKRVRKMKDEDIYFLSSRTYLANLKSRPCFLILDKRLFSSHSNLIFFIMYIVYTKVYFVKKKKTNT